MSQSDLINPLLKARDVMESAVDVCAPEARLTDVLRELSRAKSGMLPVVEGGKPVGVLTERRVVAALAESPNAADWTVARAMSKTFPKIGPEARLNALFHYFGPHGVLVVADDGQLLGVIHWLNLLGNVSERGLGQILTAAVRGEDAERSATAGRA
ncbi:MAG: CBS domain-containing protein [Candidatus Saccharimonadales bacterium]